MKHGGKKIWTCLLALALMLAMMPAAALRAEATEYSGDDTKTHYWKDLQVGDIISPGAKLNTDMDKEGKTIVVWLQGGRYCKSDGAKQTESTKVSISYFNSSDVGFGEAYSDASYRRYPYADGGRVQSWVVSERNTNGGVFLTLKGYKPYELTVENGSGGGTYHDGANVSISADAAPEGQQFKEWTWEGASVRHASFLIPV